VEDGGEGEAGVGRGEEGGEEVGGIGGAEGEEALVFEEVGEARKGGLEGVAGSEIGWGAGGGEAGFSQVEDDEAKEGDLLIETSDEAGAGVVVQMAGLEFAGVEAVFEGIGVAGLPAREAFFGGGRNGHGRGWLGIPMVCMGHVER
jgi:hypothetical protein